MTPEPVWLLRSVVEAMHVEQIREHGGAPGLRAPDLLESALARPVNLFAYGAPDVFDLAASYAFGIVKNHPFVDGNKRCAFLAAYLFLRLNQWELVAAQTDAVQTVLALAAGTLGEANFSGWLRANVKPG